MLNADNTVLEHFAAIFLHEIKLLLTQCVLNDWFSFLCECSELNYLLMTDINVTILTLTDWNGLA